MFSLDVINSVFHTQSTSKCNTGEILAAEQPQSEDHTRDGVVDDDELERDRDCGDVREKVRRKFLVDMPEDFYQFWDFCCSINPAHPECEWVVIP